MDKRARTVVKTVIVASLLVFNVLYYAGRFPTMKNGIDFPEFYSAARMVLEGAGSHLYEIPAQQEFQSRYTGRVGVLFNHPPFETLFYIPVAWLGYRAAYVLWTTLSTVLIAASMLLLNREAHVYADSGLLVMLAFIFAPVALNLLQGQDAAILLLIYTTVYAALRRNQPFVAGCVLAVGLFKPHLVLPFFLIVFVVNKSWKLLGGFAAVSALLGVVSLAISSWHAVLAYPSFVVSLGRVQLAGYHPKAMANWRGLLSLMIRGSRWQTLVLVAGSLILLWLAALSWRRSNSISRSIATGEQATPAFNLAFANTVISTLLVSYHLSPHDLTLLLLPIALGFAELRRHGVRSQPMYLLLAIVLLSLFLPPLYVIALGVHMYALMGLPILIFFACVLVIVRRLPQSRGFQAGA